MGGRKSSNLNNAPPSQVLWLIPLFLLFLWLANGIFEINEGEVGIVLRFGEQVRATGPGLHWHAPYPIERMERENIGRIRTVEVGYRTNERTQNITTIPQESLMLTEDENIIDIKFAVQYRIDNPTDYLFNLKNQVTTLHQVTESAIREVVGGSAMEYILTKGRNDITRQVHKLVQDTLNGYQAGIIITSVNMQDAQPPEQVQAAFHDAVKAREDEQRLVNEAEAYRNEILPKAQGQAARLIADADAYAAQVVEKATGEGGRFLKILKEYEKAPAITRERLYIETMEEVYAGSRKVIIDSENNNSLMYLPLDKLIQSGEPVRDIRPISTTITQPPKDDAGFLDLESNRGREIR